jgi:hypothetical protein
MRHSMIKLKIPTFVEGQVLQNFLDEMEITKWNVAFS